MLTLRVFIVLVFSYLMMSESFAAEGQSSPIHILENCLGEIKSPSASLSQKQDAARKGVTMIGALMTPIYEEKGKEGKVPLTPTIVPVSTSDANLTHVEVLKLSETNARSYHKTLYMAIFMAARLLEINLTQILTAAGALSSLKDNPRGARHLASCKSLAKAIDQKAAVNPYFNTEFDLRFTGGATNFHAFFTYMESLIVGRTTVLKPEETSRKTKAIVEAILQLSIYQRGSIEIPSDPDFVGIPVTPFSKPAVSTSWGTISSFTLPPKPAVQTSWDALPSFTRQTLANFSRGDKRGFLLVHSLEDITGVPEQFNHMWNLNHPDDQRCLFSENENKSREPEDWAQALYDTFSSDEILDHYIPYVLACKHMLACSLLALNTINEWSVNNTFAPLSFILEASSQHIVLTSRRDAYTPVYYGKKEGDTSSAKTYSAYRRATRCITLDALIRYYDLKDLDEKQAANMNEVVILSCAQNKRGKIFRPKVVGVLWRTGSRVTTVDYENAKRNAVLKKAGERFARKNNLPFLTLDTSSSLFSKQDFEKVKAEFNALPGAKDVTYNSALDDTNDPRNYIFLDDAQLAGYGVARPPSAPL